MQAYHLVRFSAIMTFWELFVENVDDFSYVVELKGS